MPSHTPRERQKRTGNIIKKVRQKTTNIGKTAGTLSGSDTRFRTAQAVRKKLGRRLGARKRLLG